MDKQPRLIEDKRSKMGTALSMDLRIFLSSTFEDLEGVRQEVLKLLSVLPAELIRMEAFGSDESKPVSYCLENVRRSNLFVGIYAERYGTVDPGTGMSLTELEYREAAKQLRNGALLGLLVYMLDPKASWPVEQVDRDPARVAALKELKQTLRANHVVTMFRDPNGLAIDVLRDTLRKIGVGTGVALRPRTTPSALPLRAGVPGMEHYTERDAGLFRGRETEISSLCDLVGSHPLSLLIGDSGIGKTSLVQAGLFPNLRKRGWSVGWCRPLDNPDRSIPSALWHQFMEGSSPNATIRATLQLVATAYEGRPVLAVIDQFEDIIPGLSGPHSRGLLDALVDAHNAPTSNLHVVVCYRGDAEPRVGAVWQQISSSSTGLPRYYLGPLTESGAANALATMLHAEFQSCEVSQLHALTERIVSDVATESQSSLGISLYTPFLQMVTEGLIKSSQHASTIPSVEAYLKIGGAKHLIGRYLSDQLSRLGSRAAECRSVLISLSGTQRRQRKSTAEIAVQTGINPDLLDSCLLDLQNLRLIHVVESHWEIVHDFLNSLINQELVAPDEREGKVLRDVLSAKSSAYESTGELLTFREHLGIYYHRNRIHCSCAELETLFTSYLHGNGPIEYFLQGIDPELPEAWARRSIEDPDIEVARNACRFLTSKGRKLPFAALARLFSQYRLQTEMADYIRRFATKEDVPTLLKLRAKRAPFLSGAAGSALEEWADAESKEITQKLLRRGDLDLLCALFIRSSDPARVGNYRQELASRAVLSRVRAACRLAMCGNERDKVALMAKAASPEIRESERYAYAFALSSQTGLSERGRNVSAMLGMGPAVLPGVLEGLRRGSNPVSAKRLLELFDISPSAVAEAVAGNAKPGDAERLRKFLKRRSLVPEARDVIIGLLRVGCPSDVRLVLERIGSADYKVAMWSVPLLSEAMCRRADASIKPWLLGFIESPEFWEYIHERPKNRIPVECRENFYLFKRLSGVVLASLCDKSDWQILRRLARHQYWAVQVAAAERISAFVTSSEFDEILADAREDAGGTAESNPGTVFVLTMLDRKLYARQC